LSMSIPNIVGMLLLSGLVSVKARDYVRRLRAGEMPMRQAEVKGLPAWEPELGG